MKMIITILIIIFLCAMFSPGSGVCAEPVANPTVPSDRMKRHMENVKIKNPQKYQEMTKRAGGNITGCTDCHIEVAKDKKSMPGGK